MGKVCPYFLVLQCEKNFLDAVWDEANPGFKGILLDTINAENHSRFGGFDKRGRELWIGFATELDCELAWDRLAFWTDDSWPHRVLSRVYICNRRRKSRTLWEWKPELAGTYPPAEPVFLINVEEPMDAAQFDEWHAKNRYDPLLVIPSMIMSAAQAEEWDREYDTSWETTNELRTSSSAPG